MKLTKKLRELLEVLVAFPELAKRNNGIVNVVKKGLQSFGEEGMDGVKQRIHLIYAGSQSGYREWIRLYDSLDDISRQEISRAIGSFPRHPKLSVVMPVYNPPLAFLDEAIRSVRQQLYSDWELCIADDASTDENIQILLRQHASEDSRIKIVFRAENGHISRASNSALELVTGEYIALLDHDDLLAEHAFFYVAKTILENPQAGIIYSDEDRLDPARGNRIGPYFKCDWNPELLRSQNFISHLGAYRTSLVREVGGFRVGFEGSQDHDLALRCSEKLSPDQIVHIPRVLYHWRVHPGSTAQGALEKPYAIQAGERAIREHLERLGIVAEVEANEFYNYRVRYAVPEPNPLVSLIIPTRNGYALLKQCIDSVLSKTQYSNYEILVIDNGSDDAETLAYFEALTQHPSIRVLRDDRPFNYSALNNAAVKLANGVLVCLLNNDIEVISPDWLTEMVSLAMLAEVGAVGARLWYPNNKLQHGGIILGIGGIAGHAHKRLPMGSPGYFGRAALTQSFSAVTAACLVIKKEIYESVGGLDEENFKIAFNDVDFCLRVRELGFRNVWTPYADLYHYESATRGYEVTPEKKRRLEQESLYFKKRWGKLLFNDPAYNPNLALENERFSISWNPRVANFAD